MGRVLFTGDIHSNPIERFSFKHHPELRTLKREDVMVVLGDGGLPFGIEAKWYDKNERARDRYNIRWLAEKPWSTVLIAGNHDDRCAISRMPIVDAFGGRMRQMMFDGIVYPNIFYVDCPGIYNINGRNCLIIPGAESRDIWNLLDPDDPDFETKRRTLNKDRKWYRIKNWTWWEDEAINIDVCEIVRKQQNWDNQYFDYILTHDSPALFCQLFESGHGFKMQPTEGELYLDQLRQELNFDCFLHGHQHINQPYPEPSVYTTIFKEDIEIAGDDRVMCLYDWIIEDN